MDFKLGRKLHKKPFCAVCSNGWGWGSGQGQGQGLEFSFHPAIDTARMTFILFATSGLQTSANIRARHTFCVPNVWHLTAGAYSAIKQPQRQGLDFETPVRPGDLLTKKPTSSQTNERNGTKRNGRANARAGARNGCCSELIARVEPRLCLSWCSSSVRPFASSLSLSRSIALSCWAVCLLPCWIVRLTIPIWWVLLIVQVSGCEPVR